MKRNCFYIPGSTGIVDVERNGISQHGKQTLDQLKEEYPDVILMDFDEAIEQINIAIVAKYVTEPIEIPQSDFDNGVGKLPTLQYYCNEEGTTFVSEERTITYYTDIFCRIEKRYFTFIDSEYMTHKEIIGKVKNSQAYLSITVKTIPIGKESDFSLLLGEHNDNRSKR